MKFSILIDPIQELNINKDTSIEILRKAMQMGWICTYFFPSDICSKFKRSYTKMYSLNIDDNNNINLNKNIVYDENIPLDTFDIILMRMNPPFRMEYIYTTYALELAELYGTLISNNPKSLRNINEKFCILNFPECSPPTLVTKKIDKIKDFLYLYKDIVIKPLDKMGGQSVFHITIHTENISGILELLTKNQNISIMVQRYIADIMDTGDKRVFIINGKPISYALSRIPPKNDFRGNISVGANYKIVSLNNRDYWICEKLRMFLQSNELHFVGIDIIGDYLTEVNITSPTCIKEISLETGIDISKIYLDYLFKLKSTISK